MSKPKAVKMTRQKVGGSARKATPKKSSIARK